MYNLKIITSTIRPGRKGPVITAWVAEMARQHNNFNVEVLDLKDMALPLMDEAKHPRMQQYEHEHSKRWAATINEADAFIFVTAEYDYNYPAPLRNALEYLYHEWSYKPAGIVSYGGLSAGLRAANSLKADLSTFIIVPLPDTIGIPHFTEFIKGEKLDATDSMSKQAERMMKELARWSKGLKLIKEDKPE